MGEQSTFVEENTSLQLDLANAPEATLHNRFVECFRNLHSEFQGSSRSKRLAGLAASLALFGSAAPATAEVTDTGYQYDPSILADQCVQDVGDGYQGDLGYNFYNGPLRGQQALTIEGVFVTPMLSRLYRSDQRIAGERITCPDPAWLTVRVAPMMQVVKFVKNRQGKKQPKLQYVQAGPEVTLVENNVNGTASSLDAMPDPQPKTFEFYDNTSYTCLPAGTKARFVQQAKKAHPSSRPPKMVRRVALRINTEASSMDHTERFPKQEDITSRDAC